MLALVSQQSARAGDAPPVPVAAFNAPQCDGTTLDDPADADPALNAGYTDLTHVFGARLDSYNAGNVVPLYDSYGGAWDTYPPLCGAYYDAESGGPESVWMFCTDITKKACGDIGAGGTLNNGATVVGDMVDRASNPRLNSDQERVIAWLLTHGYDYTPTGLNDAGATRADQTTTPNRSALQNLVWCVSDPTYVQAAFEANCAENFPPAEQAAVLAKVPGTALVDLNLSAGSADVLVGQKRVLRLRTNVFNQPITLTATGTAVGSLQVCSGPGTLSGNELTVAGTDVNTPRVVELCLTPSASGSYGLNAAVRVAQADHLQWAKADDDDCQVFARFSRSAAVDVESAVAFRVVARPILTTKASAQVVKPGAKLFDTVQLSGFVPGHGAKGRATLYGPFARVTKNVCRPANAVATVEFTPRNGSVRTPAVKVTEPGHYTWVAQTSKDSHNKAARHRCGLAAETTLVRKSTYTVTTVDSGFSGVAPSTGARRSVETLTAAAADIQGSVRVVGHRKGRMLLPGVAQVGRLGSSADIGDAIGTTVLAGHVSDPADRPGALWNLRKVRRGQVLSYRIDGKVHRYRVTGVARYSRSKPLPSQLFRTTGAHRLVVISCSDKVVRNGRFHYANNLVITAKPIG
ncbi:class F sortase [Nocardioides sp. Bht2]|uniref:class F sortase n=1 Tax=Nocardioides sp. Bht2 TaxID=3392297 RepID=UPI0039B3C9BB